MKLSLENITEIKRELELSIFRSSLGKDLNPDLFDYIITDIQKQFPMMSAKFFCEAINDGGCGKYGISHRFTIQLILSWIHRKIRENKNTDAL